MCRFATTLTVFAIVFALTSSPGYALGRFDYVGSEACKQCHREIYDSWKSSIHAKVYDILKPGVRAKEKKEASFDPKTDFRLDKSCMRCHVTGWDQGGFSFENPADELKGVGCEDCHGGAEKWMDPHQKKHLKNRKRKLKQTGLVKPFKGRTVCGKCHANVNSPFKDRPRNQERDWTDPKWMETYHILK